MSNEGKTHLGVVVCGHVDAGKSTTTGRLLFEMGGIDQRTLDKLQAEADSHGKSSFAFAYYLDNNKEERERGVTINCNTKEFFTDTKHYTIVDAPGHRDFIKNMISGAAQADAALILVPAEAGGFETAIQKEDRKAGKVQGQTRQHARLCKLLGIEQIIVGINKMDTCNWSEDRYNEIKSNMEEMLKKIGYKPSRIPFIPYSGFHGDYLTKPSDKASWYKGWKVPVSKTETVEGFTVVEALEKMIRQPKRKVDAEFRMPVNGIYKIRGVGDVIAGRIEQGVVKEGDEVVFVPSGAKGKVFSIEMHHKRYPQATPGDNVGICVKGLSKDNMVQTGDVMLPASNSNVRVKSFKAMISVQEHPGQLKIGFTPGVYVRAGRCACKMSEISWKMHPKRTNGEKIEGATFIETGDQAEVTFEPSAPFYLEKYADCAGLGRVAIMDSNQLVMLGKVVDVEYEQTK
jgi:elongation factor 1-alpha